MKKLIYLFATALFVVLYSCDTLIEPENGNVSGIRPVVLVPKEGNTTLYNNQKIIYFRLSKDNSGNNIDTVFVYHADTLLIAAQYYGNLGNFIDVRINKKFEPGTHVFKFRLIDKYKYESEITERIITILPENMPNPEISIAGLEDMELKQSKEIAIIFHTNPYKFTGVDENYSYFLEYNNFFEYNNIDATKSNESLSYIDLTNAAHIKFIEDGPVDLFFNADSYYNILNDEFVDINNISEGDEVGHAFGWFPYFNEEKTYTLYTIANNGWVQNYYWINNLKYAYK